MPALRLEEVERHESCEEEEEEGGRGRCGAAAEASAQRLSGRQALRRSGEKEASGVRARGAGGAGARAAAVGSGRWARPRGTCCPGTEGGKLGQAVPQAPAVPVRRGSRALLTLVFGLVQPCVSLCPV